MTDTVDPFSKEWCAAVSELWDTVVFPNFADPDNFHYIAEFGITDEDRMFQYKAQAGKLLWLEPGKSSPDDDCTFLLSAKRDIWQKIAEGKLDPVAAVASQRLHMRKGPMTIVIKEATAFKEFLKGWGQIPTAW